VPGLADALAGPVLEVAPRLLGAVVAHRTDDGLVAVRLTEVEAYDGANDPGSHAYNGPTRRNQVMFGPPGHLYVYFTYGMHHCANVVVGAEGDPAAVLLRAGEVVEGVELATRRRGSASARDLARGPARLCQALGVDLTHNGADLASGPLTLTVPARSPVPTADVRTGPRVGLRHAADHPWRFWVAGERSVSTYRPAVARRRRPGTDPATGSSRVLG
jgi:DNA-3-methyladenine glycosylase